MQNAKDLQASKIYGRHTSVGFMSFRCLHEYKKLMRSCYGRDSREEKMKIVPHYFGESSQFICWSILCVWQTKALRSRARAILSSLVPSIATCSITLWAAKIAWRDCTTTVTRKVRTPMLVPLGVDVNPRDAIFVCSDCQGGRCMRRHKIGEMPPRKRSN